MERISVSDAMWMGKRSNLPENLEDIVTGSSEDAYVDNSVWAQLYELIYDQQGKMLMYMKVKIDLIRRYIRLATAFNQADEADKEEYFKFFKSDDGKIVALFSTEMKTAHNRLIHGCLTMIDPFDDTTEMKQFWQKLEWRIQGVTIQTQHPSLSRVDFKMVQPNYDRLAATTGENQLALILNQHDYSVRLSDGLAKLMSEQRWSNYWLLANQSRTRFRFQLTDDVTAEKFPKGRQAFEQVKLWDVLTKAMQLDSLDDRIVMPVVKKYVGGDWGKRLELEIFVEGMG